MCSLFFNPLVAEEAADDFPLVTIVMREVVTVPIAIRSNLRRLS
jgi:hypothetical protein